MNADLSALALKHGHRPRARPLCARCHGAETAARIVVLVHEISKGNRGRQIVSKTRSLCAPCAALLADQLICALPPEGAS